MASLKHKFTKLLALELESLHDELEVIVEDLDDRLERHEITDYVRNENRAILKNEIIGLERFLHNLAIPMANDVETVDELADRISAYVKTRLTERGYVAALSELVDLRVEKIRTYLKLDFAPQPCEADR